MPPEQILAERFARGEIDEDEFHQRLTVLRAEAPHYPGPAGRSTDRGARTDRGRPH